MSKAPLSIRLTAAIVVVVLCLGGMEGALRLHQHLNQDSRTIISDNVVHHKLRPNQDSIVRNTQPPYRLVTNDMGWVEDHPIAREKPAGVFRVFFLGDSQVQGLVDTPYKMVRRVEKALKEKYPQQADRMEIINAGTSSYSMYLYHALVKNILLGYKPDLIVINVDMTDVSNDYLYRRYAVYDASGEVDHVVDVSETNKFNYIMMPTGLVPVEKSSPIYTWIVDHSAIAYYVDKVVARWRVLGKLGVEGYTIDESANWLAHEWTPEIRANVDHSMAVLASTIRLCQRNGIRVAVATVPHQRQFKGSQSAEPHAEVGRLAAREGVPFMNAYAEIERLRGQLDADTLYMTGDDIHLGREGNGVWAEAMVGFLTAAQNHLLPW